MRLAAFVEDPVARRSPAVLTALLLAVLAGCSSQRAAAPTPVTETESRPAPAPAPEPLPGPIEKFVRGKERMRGLFEVVLDRASARVWLQLPKPDADGIVAEFLYVEALAHGLGSNPVGLDRGQLGETRVVRLRRIGRRLFVEQPNLAYRAVSESADERKSVEEAFARSILWAGKVAAEDPDGSFLVEFTDFVVRDAHDLAAKLESSGQGAYTLDKERSTLDPQMVLAFPDNLEFQALLTLAGKKPGPEVRSVTPTPEAITLVQHHSFVRLPDAGYTPRAFDPRSGALTIGYTDYAAPLDAPLEKRWIVRHRLHKKDPRAARSEPVKPIVYYVDRGAPEPVRLALIEGASWWNRAFEAAGYIDAFRVELLPEGAHPLDVRYNVIQWVHRSTRGWSYGSGVVDPRTGERIKGHVSLGSLRVRQDRRIFEGLLGAGDTGSGSPDDPVQLALARIRQLSAHEVGHTIGFAHNFAASTFAGRASVMDYPAPWVRVGENETLDVSAAYGVGVGVWDEFTVRYAYTDFAPGTDERAALIAMLDDAEAKGLRFLTDQDARPVGSAHPRAHLWDNGNDAAAALGEALEVRRIALERFGTGNLPAGEPLALLQETFVPVYLFHRYQLEAAVKMVGGVNYRHKVNGDGQPLASMVTAPRQRAALEAVLEALSPVRLDIREDILSLLLPRAYGLAPTQTELMRSRTAPIFDTMGAVATAMDLGVRLLLVPERCARLVDQERRDPNQLGLTGVIDALIERAFDRREDSERLRSLQRLFQRITVDRLMERAFDSDSPDAVRVVIEDRLALLQRRLMRRGEASQGLDAAHDAMIARDLDRFLYQREWNGPTGWRALPEPPGAPIGTDSQWCD